jgi:hypothetical protein
MAIETLDLPIKNGGSFHSYVSLPEGSGAHKPTYNWEGAGLVDSTILRFINNMKGYMMNWIL